MLTISGQRNLTWQEEVESLIDAMLAFWRMIEDLWTCPQAQQRSAYPLDLNGSEAHFPSLPCCPDCRKTLDRRTLGISRSENVFD